MKYWLVKTDPETFSVDDLARARGLVANTEAAVPALMIVLIALVPILLLIRQGAKQAKSSI